MPSETVRSLEQADEWFRSHSSGRVRCERPDGRTAEVETYPDAKAFFEEPPQS